MDTWEFTRIQLPTGAGLDEEDASECFQCLWPCLSIFRLLGLCPISRFGNYLVVPKSFFNCSWIPTIVFLVLQAIVICNYFLGLKFTIETAEKVNFPEVLTYVIYFFHILSVWLFMICKIGELPDFMTECKRIEILCKKYRTPENGKLVRDCCLLLALFELPHLFASVHYYVAQFEKWNVTSVSAYFEKLTNKQIGSFGSSYTGAFLNAAEFYGDMGWNFGDTLTGLLAFILTRYFIRINTSIRRRRIRLTVDQIEEFRADHDTICQLVKLCNGLFSPLFFLTYAANMIFLFSKFYLTLHDNWTSPTYNFIVWSERVYLMCYQVLIRMLLPSYLGSRLFEEAREALQTVNLWPSLITGPATGARDRLLLIGRFEAQLAWTPVGISGQGFFLISREFTVGMLSSILSYSVLIMQCHSAHADSK